jgi:hypothetical protein
MVKMERGIDGPKKIRTELAEQGMLAGLNRIRRLSLAEWHSLYAQEEISRHHRFQASVAYCH